MHKLIIQKRIKFKNKLKTIPGLNKQQQQKQKLKCKLNFIEIDEADGHQSAKRVRCERIELGINNKNTYNNSPIHYLNEQDLWFLTEKYENLNEWKQIGKYLNLTEQELLIIEMKYLVKDSLKECFYQMLLKWRLKEPENCYFDYLLNKFKINNNTFQLSIEDKTDIIQKRFDFYYNKYFQNNDEIYCKLKNFKLTEKNLWHASGYLFQEWKSIARYLSLDENEICLIDNKYSFKDGLRECCYQMLIKWRELFPNDCYLFNLCFKLIKIKLNLYVCQLLEYFSQNISLLF